MELRVSHTGIRNGEYITSSSSGKQNKGSILQIRGVYPPSAKRVKEIPQHVLRDYFNNFEFFEGMSLEERFAWLTTNSISNDDLYLSDQMPAPFENLWVKVHALEGTDVQKKLDAQTISTLIRGNPDDPEGYWPMSTLYGAFPKKPGSRAARHVLIFRPSNWSLMKSAGLEVSFNGLVIDPLTCTISQKSLTTSKGEQLLTVEFSGTKIGIHYPPSADAPDFNVLFNHFKLNTETIERFGQLISWFPPSLYKSLIQKIIRTRCTHIEFAGVEYPAIEAFACTFKMLYEHGGSFSPENRRHVGGIESATKRLAVSIAEDSSITDPLSLGTLFCAGYVAQNGKKWHPPLPVVAQWLLDGMYAIGAENMYEYDWKHADESIKEWNPLYIAYLALKNTGSFDSDVKMMASIAHNNGKLLSSNMDSEWNNMKKRVMPLVHCIDQHSFTEIGHYISPQYVSSYPELFGLIWDLGVAFNPRKAKFDAWNLSNRSHPFQQNILTAQNNVWISRTYKPQPIKSTSNSESTKFEYTIDDSWLASFIGGQEITIGRNSFIATLDPRDLTKVMIMRRPRRDVKDPPKITEEENDAVEGQFIQLLSRGIKLTNVPSTLPSFKGATLTISPEDYLINGIPWKQAKIVKERFQMYDYPLPSFLSSLSEKSTEEEKLEAKRNQDNAIIRMALTQTGMGIHKDANDLLIPYLKSLPPKVLKRAALYLSNFNTDIKIYRISRVGESSKYGVAPEDTSVNVLFCHLCCWYPGALRKDGDSFKVNSGILFWSLSKIICDRASKATISSSVQSAVTWNEGKDDHRTLYDHQREAIEDLHNSKDIKVKTIWIDPGLGKSSIICHYIQDLIKAKKMPKYCLWIMPQAAIETITKEISYLGLDAVFLDQRKAANGPHNLIPGRINIIYHHHLIMSNLDNLRDCAPDMLFINDEFHNTFSAETKITAAALEIAKLSYDSICMTGTLIKSDDPTELIEWLSLAVKFEVTKNNYWVAIASIINRKASTGVKVERQEIDVEMDPQTLEAYLNVVPENLGGRTTKINFREALRLSNEATTVGMIQQILLYLRHGLPCFVIARNRKHQQQLKTMLEQSGIQSIQLIENQVHVNYTPDMLPNVPQVVITIPTHREGYNLSAYRILIHGVFMSNQASREQLERRINRLSQTAESVRIITLHSGILSYINKKYDIQRSLAKALADFGKEVNEDFTTRDLE